VAQRRLAGTMGHEDLDGQGDPVSGGRRWLHGDLVGSYGAAIVHGKSLLYDPIKAIYMTPNAPIDTPFELTSQDGRWRVSGLALRPTGHTLYFGRTALETLDLPFIAACTVMGATQLDGAFSLVLMAIAAPVGLGAVTYGRVVSPIRTARARERTTVRELPEPGERHEPRVTFEGEAHELASVLRRSPTRAWYTPWVSLRALYASMLVLAVVVWLPESAARQWVMLLAATAWFWGDGLVRREWELGADRIRTWVRVLGATLPSSRRTIPAERIRSITICATMVGWVARIDPDGGAPLNAHVAPLLYPTTFVRTLLTLGGVRVEAIQPAADASWGPHERVSDRERGAPRVRG
jgi:hypothetical protein